MQGTIMPKRVLSRAEVHEIDRRAIEELGLPGIVLMENAGRGAAELLLQRTVTGPVVVCAGKGNNGGDGFVIARHLENHQCPVRVLLFADPDQLRGDAAVNYHVLAAAGTPITLIETPPEPARLDDLLRNADWIVDALLGTGMRGQVREPYATVIDRINAADSQMLAVDLPSGMDCDSGRPLGCCVRADLTATFVARKLGFDAPAAAAWLGEVHVIDIGVPRGMLS